MLSPALVPGGNASHAYLFHGPEGAGKRAAARALAAELLVDGASDPESARARVVSGAHFASDIFAAALLGYAVARLLRPGGWRGLNPRPLLS